MVIGRLVFVQLYSAIYLCNGGFSFEGTWLAPHCSAEEAKGADFHQRFEFSKVWKEAEEDSSGDRCIAISSRVEPRRGTCLRTLNHRYDMVLQSLRSPESPASGKVPQLQTALGRCLEAGKKKDKEQEQVSEICERDTIGCREERRRVASISGKSPLGAVHSIPVFCIQNRHTDGGHRKGFAAAAAASPSSTTRNSKGGGRGVSFHRRAEAPRAPTWFEWHAHGTPTGDDAAVERAGAKGTKSLIGQGIVPWTFESTQSSEESGDWCSKAHQGVGCRMERLHGENDGSCQGTCSTLPRMPFRSLGDIQPEASGTACAQRRSFSSFQEPHESAGFGFLSRGNALASNAVGRDATVFAGRRNSCPDRRVGRAGGSDRGHGGRGIAEGAGGQGERGQKGDDSYETFQIGCIANWSGQDSFEAQERQAGEGKRLQIKGGQSGSMKGHQDEDGHVLGALPLPSKPSLAIVRKMLRSFSIESSILAPSWMHQSHRNGSECAGVDSKVDRLHVFMDTDSGLLSSGERMEGNVDLHGSHALSETQANAQWWRNVGVSHHVCDGDSRSDYFPFGQDPDQNLPLSTFCQDEKAGLYDINVQTPRLSSFSECGQTGRVQREFEPQCGSDGASHSLPEYNETLHDDRVVAQSYELVRRTDDWLHSFGEQQSWCRRQKRKQVLFLDKVKVVCFHGNETCAFEINENECEWWLRNFWHLHGQVMSWDMMLSYFAENSRSINFPLQQGAQMTHLERGQYRENHPSTLGVNLAGGKDFQGITDAWESCWNENMRVWKQHERVVSGRFIATWLLVKDHVHVCLQHRRVRIQEGMSASDFQQACRQTWWDHLSFLEQELTFYLVQPKPPGLPSTIAHVIIVQGEHENYNCVLYQGETLPVLRKQRAVLFHDGLSVRDFFVEAQHPSACQILRASCFIQYGMEHMRVVKTEHEQMEVPKAAFVIGEVRVLEDESDNEEVVSDDDFESVVMTNEPSDEQSQRSESDSDEWSQLEELEAQLPSWVRSENDTQFEEGDANLLMSGAPVLMQFDHPDPYPWQIEPHMGFVEPEEEEIDTFFADQHQQQLQEYVDQALEGVETDNTVWQAITFGVGLLDLGRRDFPFHPLRLHELPDLVQQAWWDHAQYGR